MSSQIAAEVTKHSTRDNAEYTGLRDDDHAQGRGDQDGPEDVEQISNNDSGFPRGRSDCSCDSLAVAGTRSMRSPLSSRAPADLVYRYGASAALSAAIMAS